MPLFSIAKHRRFVYRPSANREFAPSTTIRFHRLYSFDPHLSKKTPKLLFFLLIVVLGLMAVLGGSIELASLPILKQADVIEIK